MTTRRQFIKDASLTGLLLAAGGVSILHASDLKVRRRKVKLRFILASDGHYGQPGTEFDRMYAQAVTAINDFHNKWPAQYTFINGDIVHNNITLLPAAKAHLDKLRMPWYVSRGNHDHATSTQWEQVWNQPLNQVVIKGSTTFIIADTSNEVGKYLSPNLTWMEQQLEAARGQKQVFLILHIPQMPWTSNAIDTPAFVTLVAKYKNIKAVFHGHEHDQDGLKELNGIPYFFDAHFGGDWGTPYKGFRVVEILKDDSIHTFIMNPVQRINELTR